MARTGDVRSALVAATTALVAEVGYAATTTKAIAARAGVSEGSIYRHFPDKHALFTAAVLEGQRPVVEWMSALPARAGTRTVREVLTDAFEHLSRLREDLVPLEVAMAAMPGARPPAPPAGAAGALGEAVAERGGPPHLLAQYLRAEQDLGRVRGDVDAARLAVLLLAALFGAQTSPLAGAAGLGPEAVGELVAVLTEGVAAPAG
ncbi:TetR/AcrR family transcriptional regulator [Kineococcus terrestris]|uniref:TetR/AcrR family transcriptional regulator n=1 Tax=Kineococcus terrestris TaxID=2044856 RepID=UPI0034DB08F0